MGLLISKCYTISSLGGKTHQGSSSSSSSAAHVVEAGRVKALEEEVVSLELAREREAEEWRREREALRERIRGLEAAAAATNEEWRQRWLGATPPECQQLVELQVKEERAQREAAVEKWKQLYLAIKTELDRLILTTKTHAAGGFGSPGAAGEGVAERLRMEVMAKEETVEALRSRISWLEKEGTRREREVDILRQSLRILNRSKTRRNSHSHRKWRL